MLEQNLTIDREAIAEFCRRHHIRWLAIFGPLPGGLPPAVFVDRLIWEHENR